MRFVTTALAGAVTVAFAQLALAQGATGTRVSPSVNVAGSYSSNDRHENNDRYGASGGQTRDRDDERHGRADDDHDRGRSGRD